MVTSTESTELRNGLSFDLEDWYQVLYFDAHFPRSQWAECESRLEPVTRRLLGILDEYGAKAVSELACRICCRLDYACRHLHRTVLGVHRIRRLRRQIGVDLHPFAPMPKRPKHHVRFRRIVARIRVEEARLVGPVTNSSKEVVRFCC